MQIHLLCIISIHSYIIPVVYVIFKFSCLAFSSFGPFSLPLLLYVQFKLCFPASLDLFPSLLDFFSLPLLLYVQFKLCFPAFLDLLPSLLDFFSPLLSLYVQFKLCFPASLDLFPSLLDFFLLFYPFMSNSSSVFLLFSICFLLFWTFFSFPTPLCPIQLVILL